MIKKPDNRVLDVEDYETFLFYEKRMNEAVRQAQEESRRLGVPNVYSINGILHWELPDGSLTTQDPGESQ